MDASSGSSGDSGDKRDRNQSSSEGNPSFHFTPRHLAQLEAYLKLCPHPDETQLHIIARDLGLDPEQIYHWFQTKIQGDHEGSESELESPSTEVARKKERRQMLEIADAAISELLKLMTTDNPLWTKSYDIVGFVLVPESYANLFPRAINLPSPDIIHQESSKDSIVVKLGVMQLIEMFLDSENWANLFPTIVSKAKTLRVFDIGSLENKSGALQLMYGEIHVLSPLVPSREFIFLRSCEQVGDGLWLITDVSVDNASLDNNYEGQIPDSPLRKFPSGCMIKQLPNGFSKVTWIEHVEVQEKSEIDNRYKELISNNFAFGANRWLFALYKMCEKIACTSIQYLPAHREISSPRGREVVINLSNRMVQNFCKILNLRDRPHFTSFHVGRNELFWDVLSVGNPLEEITYIPISDTSRISVIKTFNRDDNDLLIFQESSIDHLGAYVVFAPLDEASGEMVMNGESTNVAVLPSGFMISGDNSAVAESRNPHRSGGTLLTTCYQVLVCHDSLTLEMKVEAMKSLIGLIISTIQRITLGLECPNCWL
ncbi:START domain [Sesbania bispinosa]|nr:START domain [Sesbania bispinosa]